MDEQLRLPALHLDSKATGEPLVGEVLQKERKLPGPGAHPSVRNPARCQSNLAQYGVSQMPVVGAEPR